MRCCTMAFSEKIKNIVKHKACFRCVICHQPFVEIHHIIPQSEQGPDTEENAVPLCAGCHDLYGANPAKRKQIREMRDHWYLEMEKRYRGERDIFDPIETLSSEEQMRFSKGIALYHYVYRHEGYMQTAHMLFNLVKKAETSFPGKPRYLYLEIEEHRNSSGGFDDEMFDLQRGFILEFLSKYLTRVITPLGAFERKNKQNNDIPDELKIYTNEA